MSDKKVLLFGSFTEDETRLFQRQSLQNDAHTTVKAGLQFGSVDFASLSTLKDSSTQARRSKQSLQSKDVRSSKQSLKNNNESPNALPKNSVDLGKDTWAQTNGVHVDCPSNEGVIENGKEPFDLASLQISDEPIGSEQSPSSLKVRECITLNDEGESMLVGSRKVVPVLDAPKESSYKEQPKSILPRGLVNPGNLCFLNATLQALLSCPPFVNLLQDLRNQSITKNAYPTLHAFVEFISEFDMPIASPKNNEKEALEAGKSFNPIMFDVVLRNFTPDLPSGTSGRPRQEDAQEFLSFLMDQMHDELLKMDGHLSNLSGSKMSLVSSEEDDGWETVGPKNKSAITRTQSFLPSQLSSIFGGQLRSVVKARGNKDSATVQPFLLLHLDIFPDAVHTIEDALHLFSTPETLEGYRTSAGKAGVVSASKSVKIKTLSKILILHLMRFSYGSKGSTKLHKPIHFPLELILRRELLDSPSTEGRKYELVATITHHGREPSKGHYTTDAKYSVGRWLRYDDASVTTIPTNKVLHDQAYVLFYKQV